MFQRKELHVYMLSMRLIFTGIANDQNVIEFTGLSPDKDV